NRALSEHKTLSISWSHYRIDSLIFTAPVFFYFIRYCCY
ncbi:hypothetical protein, partial [Escherichia coli]